VSKGVGLVALTCDRPPGGRGGLATEEAGTAAVRFAEPAREAMLLGGKLAATGGAVKVGGTDFLLVANSTVGGVCSSTVGGVRATRGGVLLLRVSAPPRGDGDWGCVTNEFTVFLFLTNDDILRDTAAACALLTGGGGGGRTVGGGFVTVSAAVDRGFATGSASSCCVAAVVGGGACSIPAPPVLDDLEPLMCLRVTGGSRGGAGGGEEAARSTCVQGDLGGGDRPILCCGGRGEVNRELLAFIFLATFMTSS